MKSLIIWPSKEAIRKNLTEMFKGAFRDCICIIDCSEIFIERPSNLTWSNYKHNNTCKYLISISPAGAVMCLSEGWAGRFSDRQIALESGFLENITAGNCLLADKGFLIQKEVNEEGEFLEIPKFIRGMRQLSAEEVDESKQLAHVRIHVERVIHLFEAQSTCT